MSDKQGDGSEVQQADPKVPDAASSEASGQAEQAKVQQEDSPGHGAFAPSSAVLILERDGVTVRQAVNALNGDGAKVALERLKANLLLKRADQPLPPEPALSEITGAGTAAAAGHDPDPENGLRCRKCGIARWAQLGGAPCNDPQPVQVEQTDGKTDSGSQAQDTGQ